MLPIFPDSFMIKLLCFISSLFLGIIITGCNPENPVSESGKTVKIGIIAPLSGPDERIGKNGMAGVRASLALSPYLLNGDKVELVIEDDQGNPELTAKALYRLAEVEKVAAILMFSKSASVLHVAKEAEYHKIPVLSLLATHPDITNDWVSQFFFDDHIQATVAALYILDELLIDHVAVIHDIGDPHSEYLTKQFKKVFESAGGIVEEKIVSSGTTDFRAILNTLKNNGLMFCYLPLGAKEVILIERQARELNWHPQVMLSDGLLSSIRLQAESNLDFIDEMYAVDIYAVNLNFTDFGKSLVKKYHQDITSPGTTFSATGAEGTHFLIKAMDRCGDSSDRGCINRMLRNNEYSEGIFGNIRIREDGKTERPVFINKIESGNLEFVVKIN